MPPVAFRKAVALAVGIRLDMPDSLHFGWVGAASMESAAHNAFYEAFDRKDLIGMMTTHDVCPHAAVASVAIFNGGRRVFLVLASCEPDLQNLTGQMFSELRDTTVELTEEL